MAHVFGERTLATLERLLSLLSAFEVVVWMTDGWPLYDAARGLCVSDIAEVSASAGLPFCMASYLGCDVKSVRTA